MNLLQKIKFSCTLMLMSYSVLGMKPAYSLAADSQPFSAECKISPLGIEGQAECTFAGVPAGKRWVIETVTGSLQLPTGIKAALIDLHITTGGVTTDNPMPAKFQGTSDFYPGDFYTINENVRLYQDGGYVPFFNVDLTNNAPSATGFLTLSGYLVDVH
jgi:hypothetical protein